MIRIALILTPGGAWDAVPLIAEDTGVLEVVGAYSTDSPPDMVARALPVLSPEVVLLSLDGGNAGELLYHLRKALRNVVYLGFSSSKDKEFHKEFEHEGLRAILQAPFSPVALEAAVHEALRQDAPADHPNLVLFLPAKAGCGCSTVSLTTAASLANDIGLRSLLIEADRRSGVMSILLDREGSGGLPAILADAGRLSPVNWNQHIDSIGKLDLLLANPLAPGRQPMWSDFFHILSFIKTKYEFVVVDLPELVNPATAELAAAARTVFIVCEPELTSLKMVRVRSMELQAAGVPIEKICVLANRWEPNRLTRELLEGMTGLPMYAALPNDYQEVKNAAVESRLVSNRSAFGVACATLARRVSGRPQLDANGPFASLFRMLPKIAG